MSYLSAVHLKAEKYVPLLALLNPFSTYKLAIVSGVTLLSFSPATIIAAEVGPHPLEPIVCDLFPTEV